MGKFLFLLTLLILPAAALAKTKAEWKASLYGRSTDDSFSSSRTVGTSGVVRLRHLFTEDLEAKLVGGVALETGTSSSLFTNEFEPKSRLFLSEASLRWRVFGPVKMIGGALSQSHHSSPLWMSGGTFPAAMLSLDPNLGKWLAHFDAQAAIPTSRTFSTRSTGKEETPLLYTQKAVLGWNDPKDSLRAILRVSHFQFKNLTRGMAQDSRFYGNQVSGIGPASQFVYEYDGWEIGPDFVVPVGSSFTWSLGGSYVQNSRGPRGTNQGLYGYSELAFRAENFGLAPKVEYYRNEEDSAPAFFTSSEFGHNNRRGLGASLKLDLPKAGLEFELKGRQSELLRPSPFQRDKFEYIELSVEIPYAGF